MDGIGDGVRMWHVIARSNDLGAPPRTAVA